MMSAVKYLFSGQMEAIIYLITMLYKYGKLTHNFRGVFIFILMSLFLAKAS